MFTYLGTILSNLLRGSVTRLYPFDRRPPIPGSRGKLRIDPATCVYCGICVKRCPANALAVARDPKSWTLDPYRCILCGYCVEACPKKCLHFDAQHLSVND